MYLEAKEGEFWNFSALGNDLPGVGLGVAVQGTYDE